MVERGYENVKTVDGGGAAMEKIFDYYNKTYYGGKIVNPRTGQVIDIKSQE
jgi:hypothetical protein